MNTRKKIAAGLFAAGLAVTGATMAAQPAQAQGYLGTTQWTWDLGAMGMTITTTADWYDSVDGLGNHVEAPSNCRMKNNSLVYSMVWKSVTLVSSGVEGDNSALDKTATIGPGATLATSCVHPGEWAFIVANANTHLDFRVARVGWNYVTVSPLNDTLPG